MQDLTPDRSSLDPIEIASRVGISVACDVVEPETLKRSEGKAQRVVDLRR